jgi:3'(2'), 5'-bisphosphate nucleotidase
VQSERFWLVDPLDGTRDFLNRTDDFTVCIGLVEHGIPVFGVVSAPAHGVTYYGSPTHGSFRIADTHDPVALHVATDKTNVVLISRSHTDDATAEYIAKQYPTATTEQVGSQLKLPRIAEGSADVYPRIDCGLHLWDLAAGQAILTGAGGSVVRPDGSAIDYRDPSLRVGDFIASSTPLVGNTA